jgi:hypothetical protein
LLHNDIWVITSTQPCGGLSSQIPGWCHEAQPQFRGAAPTGSSLNSGVVLCFDPEADEDEEDEDASSRTLTKRARFGMSDAELARACTIMNLPAAQATPKFLKDKPLDVRLYAPRLIEPTSSIQPCARPTRRSHDSQRRFYVFEGDFLDLEPATFLPMTPLVMSMKTAILSPSQLSSCFAVRLLAQRAKHQHSADVLPHKPCSRLQLGQLRAARVPPQPGRRGFLM